MSWTRGIAFALLLLVQLSPAWGQVITRGPYLQILTDQSVVVRWRTDSATDSLVRYGLSDGALTLTSSVAGPGTEHTVQLSGLNAQTEYFYSVGDISAPMAGGTEFHFRTAPVPGTATATRFWAIGDSGTAVTHPGQAAAVRDAFKTYSASAPADFMIMLGDNAYNDGTDAEYQVAVFDTYPVLLQQLPVWSTLGNHDGHSADSAT